MVEEMVLPAALRAFDLGGEVIEVGPGPGFTTDVLRSRTDRLAAVELDADLAGALAHRLAGTNVDVIRGDATALGLPTGHFSAATSFNMLHHVPSDDAQDRVLGELTRVLRAGGLFVCADGVDSEGTRVFHEGDTYNPIDPDGLETRLAAAGFTEIEIRSYDLGWTCSARAAA